jgi:hypothetical protein
MLLPGIDVDNLMNLYLKITHITNKIHFLEGNFTEVKNVIHKKVSVILKKLKLTKQSIELARKKSKIICFVSKIIGFQ